ncbi:InlB B-repeat-containing protein, partial [Frankia sp. Cas3]|uniref:InlB B-repeat-containing protein n=1 Tax=Frankia sp. Cas3 TaxID=3073926 RepID=UPI002AD53850
MRRRRLTRPARGARLGAALAGVVVLGALVAAGWLGDVPARSVALDDGSAWLVSSVGQAALVDGSSAQVVAQVKVGEGGADLSAAQSGADAFVANTSDGSVRRVDGATFAVGNAARFANAGQSLAVYPGRQAVYAVTAQSGLVTTADPLTLQVRAQQSLAARVAPGAAQLDGAGRLWLVDANTGDLIWLDGAGRHTRRGAVDPARATLVRSGDTVVIVDVVARTARPLRADGGTDAGGCVDTQVGDTTVTVAGSTSADRVYAASGRRGVLLVSDLSHGSCDTAVDLRAAGHDLGAPHEAAGRVFIPDFTAGQVIVVDVGARRLVASPKVLPERTRFELVSQGSFMFYNDPRSAQAGVVRLDGSVRQTEKYNPKNPGNGVVQGPGSGNPTQSSPTQSSPTQSSPTQSPVTSPPTGPTTPPTGQPQQAKGDVQIRVSATQVVVNQPVELRVVATNGGIVASVAWTFGDDAPTSGVQVSHSWPKPGVYTVRAQTRLADGRQATPTATITVVADEQSFATPIQHPTDSQHSSDVIPTRSATPTPSQTSTPTRPPDGFTLSISTSGNGSVTGNPGAIDCPSGGGVRTCTASYAAGTQVTLTAAVASGSAFSGWSGDCTGTGTCTVTMDMARNVTATFT